MNKPDLICVILFSPSLLVFLFRWMMQWALSCRGSTLSVLSSLDPSLFSTWFWVCWAGRFWVWLCLFCAVLYVVLFSFSVTDEFYDLFWCTKRHLFLTNTKNIFRLGNDSTLFNFSNISNHMNVSFVTLNRISRVTVQYSVIWLRFDCHPALSCPESFPKSERRPRLGEISRSYVRSNN